MTSTSQFGRWLLSISLSISKSQLATQFNMLTYCKDDFWQWLASCEIEQDQVQRSKCSRVLHSLHKFTMTVSPENAASPKSTKSRVSDSSVSCCTDSNWHASHFHLNLFRRIRVGRFDGFRGCSIFSGDCRIAILKWKSNAAQAWYMCIDTYMYTYVYMYVNIKICISIYTIYVYTYIYMYTYICTYIYVYEYIYICTYIYVYEYIYVYIYIYACVYIYAFLSVCA